MVPKKRTVHSSAESSLLEELLATLPQIAADFNVETTTQVPAYKMSLAAPPPWFLFFIIVF